MEKRICLLPLVLLSALLLYGCVRKPYFPPNISVPTDWRYGSEEENSDLNTAWWKNFQDPVLDDLIQEAVSCNLDLRIAATRVEEYAARLAEVRADLYPQAYLQGEAAGSELSVRSTPLPALTKRVNNFYSLLGSVSYELDFWGRLQSRTGAARAELLGEEEMRKNVLLSVVANTASAYFFLRQYDLQLEVACKTRHSRDESYRIAKIRFDEGLISELEVKQAESEVEDAKIEIIQLKKLRALQEDSLCTLLGRYPQSLPVGKKIDEMPTPPAVPAGIPSRLLCRRPDILRAEYGILAAHERINEARAAFFPDFSLTSFFGFESLHLKDLLTNKARTWQYAAQFLQPLFTGGNLTAQLELARVQKKSAYERYIKTILTAFQEVEDALFSYQNAIEDRKAQIRRQQVLSDYLYLADLRYHNGQTSYLDFLDAERNLFAAELDLAQSEANVRLSLVSLYKALGGGWIEVAQEVSFCRQ